MNIFARKIHFYYRHKEWADAIFDRLVKEDEGEILAARRYIGEIVYKDETVVRFIPATSNARGYRCHLAYIEASYVGGLDWEFCSTIVMPKMLGEWRNTGPGQVYALSDVKALMRDLDSEGFCIPAKEYFRMQEDGVKKFIEEMDKRVLKECDIAEYNNALVADVKIAVEADKRLKAKEATSKLEDYAAENPETAECMKKYIEDYETLEEKIAGIDAALRRAKKYAPKMIHILDDCK